MYSAFRRGYRPQMLPTRTDEVSDSEEENLDQDSKRKLYDTTTVQTFFNSHKPGTRAPTVIKKKKKKVKPTKQQPRKAKPRKKEVYPESESDSDSELDYSSEGSEDYISPSPQESVEVEKKKRKRLPDVL